MPILLWKKKRQEKGSHKLGVELDTKFSSIDTYSKVLNTISMALREAFIYYNWAYTFMASAHKSSCISSLSGHFPLVLTKEKGI